jgi:uncharacterized protein (TIGR02596 family)
MPKRCAQNRGLSLFELLVVVAILATLIALATEGYFSTIAATAVTIGADRISDALTEARTSAIAQNTTVEVRFYSAPPPAGGAPVYGALQLHWCKADLTTPPVAEPVLLPGWVVIDSTATHSPLIGANTVPMTLDATDPRMNSATRVFHFLPDGSTDLNPATNWFLTVRAATQSDPAHFPSNWACVGLNATTGRTEIYRP